MPPRLDGYAGASSHSSTVIWSREDFSCDALATVVSLSIPFAARRNATWNMAVAYKSVILLGVREVSRDLRPPWSAILAPHLHELFDSASSLPLSLSFSFSRLGLAAGSIARVLVIASTKEMRRIRVSRDTCATPFIP